MEYVELDWNYEIHAYGIELWDGFAILENLDCMESMSWNVKLEYLNVLDYSNVK